MFQFIFLINCRVTAETKINCCTVAEYIKKKNCIKSKVLHQNKISSNESSWNGNGNAKFMLIIKSLEVLHMDTARDLLH